MAVDKTRLIALTALGLAGGLGVGKFGLGLEGWPSLAAAGGIGAGAGAGTSLALDALDENSQTSNKIDQVREQLKDPMAEGVKKTFSVSSIPAAAAAGASVKLGLNTAGVLHNAVNASMDKNSGTSVLNIIKKIPGDVAKYPVAESIFRRAVNMGNKSTYLGLLTALAMFPAQGAVKAWDTRQENNAKTDKL